MDEQNMRETLRKYIAAELIRDPDYPLQDTEPIITGGLIDSFALAELAVFIEETFDVYIPNPELTVERMDTLDQIVERVKKG